jgi:hypothetical protein
VANIPHCWALWRRVFKLRSFINGRTATGTPERALDIGSRRGTGATIETSESQIGLSRLPSAHTRELSFDRPVGAKRGTGSRIDEEMMKGRGDSYSGSAEVPRGQLEMELRRLDEM